MESYVWYLSHELIRLGYQVTIICEQCEFEPDKAIRLIVLTASVQRRRWKAMKDFNRRLDQLFQDHPELLGSIIHSHERTAWHHVTTFHGPPMKKTPEFPWYKKFSRRLTYWLNVEYQELCAPHVQKVVPVSKMIREELLIQYPESRSRMTKPAYPALAEANPKGFRKCGQLLKLVFAGKEWKRKGLSKAVEISQLLAEKYSVHLDVYGVSADDAPNSLNRSFVTYCGYQPHIPFDKYDLLIHPAFSEPFGMVVLEALASGCRALVSDRVGAGEINHEGLCIKSIDTPLSEWAAAASELIDKIPGQLSKFETWVDVAMYHHLSVYKEISR
jgi:UDP-glucose:(heptosyl)LPS alpha-1,3-glucosyltransferase